MIFLGNEIGGRWMKEGYLQADMTLFSFGVGEDISFELECLKLGVKVFCFDPTPRSIDYINQFSHDNLQFYSIGISNHNGTEKFYVPKDSKHVSHSIHNIQGTQYYFEAEVMRLNDIIKMVGIEPDIVKLDIEGEEYCVLDKMRNYPKCLMVEFHGDQEFFYADYVRAKYKEIYKNGHDWLFL